jgi:hypothetical protein
VLCGTLTGTNAQYFNHARVDMKFVRLAAGIEHASHYCNAGLGIEYARSWGRVKFVIVYE